ncbi:Pleckstrin homology domain-containing family G member 7 [Schistosoma japonicum]|nr:Pleckstrin homology domain-containing family G member 7 [Schistosoma japonicum]
MTMKQGKSVFVRSKLRMLKRTNTMHIGYTGPQDVSSNLQRHESWQSLELDTAPSSSGTGEGESMSIKTTTATTTSITNENPSELSVSNQGVQDNEQIDLASRRGRRSAIIDKKNLIGESEVENQESTTVSQNVNKALNETGQERSTVTSSVNSFRERQKRILRKQNTIADLSCRNQMANTNQDYEFKRRANVFMKLIERGTRSKDLNEALQSLKSSYFHDQYLESFRDFHWSQLDKSGNSENTMPDREVRRREAVWELFKSELTFFIDHLMVLKNCFMEPLKKLQVDGYLMFVEPMHLFGNLDDLCYVSHTFCRELISNLSQESVTNEFGSTDVLLRPLKRWSEHSRDGEIYHNYCLNYDSALTYLDSLRKFEHFNEFEKWCEQDTRCRRLQLTDLLVAPMQHYMKIPLLLSSIRRYTACSAEQEMLTASLTKVENSLKTLEDKMRWLKNFERLQEIQSQLIWPSVSELEPRVFIPEFLRQSLIRQPCERLIANPKRQLLHEGFLTLNDGTKTIEIFAFLFDDFLLVTRIKKPPKKKSFSENPLTGRSITEGGVFVVYRQIIALDRFTIHDLGIVEATANGLRNAIVLVLITRFQQITGVYTLQAANELDKQRWIEKLRNSQQAFQEKLKRKLYGIDVDQHTNKHSKLINTTKNKLIGQTSITDDYFCTSLPYGLKDTEDKFSKLSETSEITQDADLNNLESMKSKSTSRKLVRSKTVEAQHQENDLQEYDSSGTDDPSRVPKVEVKYESVRNDVIVKIADESSISRKLEVDNTLSVNTDCSSDESVSIRINKIKSNDILSMHNKTSDYIIRNRHSLDPNFSNLSISDVKYTDTTDITKPSIMTISSPSTNAQTTPVTEKQIVAPIFSPPSLLLFDRVTQHNEFPYELTKQAQFSPPLSPILHAPCASLPLEITAQNLYDLPDRLMAKLDISEESSKLDKVAIEKRSIKEYSPSPPVNRRNEELHE